MTSGHDRRQILRAGAALCSLSIAGCLNGGDDSSGNRTDASSNATDPDNAPADGANETETDADQAEESAWEPVDGWPQFHADAQKTGYKDADAPTGGIETLWTYENDADFLPSPAVTEDTAYVLDGNAVAHAIDEDGVQWSTELESVAGATPALTEDCVVHGTNQWVVSLDRETGEEVWRYDAVGSPRNVTVYDGVVYAPTWGDEMAALDAASGELEWNVFDGYFGQPAIHDGELYVARASEGDEERTTAVVALDLEDGEQRTAIEPEASIETGLTIRDGTGFFGTGDGVYAYDLETATRRWHYPTDEPVIRELAATDDAVFFRVGGHNVEGTLHAVSRSEGERQWTAPANFDHASPIVVGETVVFARNDEVLAAHDVASGEESWTTDTGFAIQTTSFANGRYYVPNAEGELRCYAES